MIAQLRAELLKQRSTRTGLGLLLGLIALVVLAMLLHGLSLPPSTLASHDHQLTVLGRGELLGSLFAGLLGAVSITAEYRHGTIRPTFLAMPRRGRVLAAKVSASMLIGASFGVTACGLAALIGTAALRARGIGVQLDAGDVGLLVGGGGAAAALWAALGTGVGALVRNQVPALVGICAWLLFVESLLVGDVAGVTKIGRFGPGAAAAAITGQEPATLLSPPVGILLLVTYASAAALAGTFAAARRDVG